MNIKEKYTFGGIEAFRFGFGPLGPPLMSVFFFYMDGIVVDTAQSNMQKYVLGALKGKKTEKVLLTHHHEDHSGNASAISGIYNVKIYGHGITACKMANRFRIKPYQVYTWGKSDQATVYPLPAVIETAKYKLTPIHTPGHSSDHTVYLEKNHGWLFSGDLYLGEKIKYFRSDEIFKDQIDSIKTVLQYDFDALFCAHNPIPEKGRAKLANKLLFLEELYGKVHTLKDKGWSEEAIVKTLQNGKDRLVKCVTLGNVSFAQMVRSALKS